jgi:hypothetical protein
MVLLALLVYAFVLYWVVLILCCLFGLLWEGARKHLPRCFGRLRSLWDRRDE